MGTIPNSQDSVSVDDYLRLEEQGEIKHEYLAGQMLAMTEASDRHGLLVTSLSALLLPHARRKGCQVFTSDMKVRLDHEGDTWFYYPDLLLGCDANDRASPHYRQRPCLIVEVLSPSTETIDTREKLIAYRLLPSLREYLMLRQDRCQADLYQSGGDGRWQLLRVSGAQEALPLRCLDARPSLGEIYCDVPELLG